jgi:hypothetical protein
MSRPLSYLSFTLLLVMLQGGGALAQATTSYAYDPPGQVRQVTSSIQNTTYAYDAAGNRTTVTDAAVLSGQATPIASSLNAQPSSNEISPPFAFPPPSPLLSAQLPPPTPPLSVPKSPQGAAPAGLGSN